MCFQERLQASVGLEQVDASRCGAVVLDPSSPNAEIVYILCSAISGGFDGEDQHAWQMGPYKWRRRRSPRRIKHVRHGTYGRKRQASLESPRLTHCSLG